MRINKSLIPGSNRAKDTYFHFDQKEAWAVFSFLLGVGLILWALVAGYSWLTPSKEETQEFKNICAKLADGNEFFIARNGNLAGDQMHCNVILPKGDPAGPTKQVPL
jgi:hypothetical protein